MTRRRAPRPTRAAAPRAAESFSAAWLGARLRELLHGARPRALCVAFSGGLDSSVLLCALASLRRRQRFALRALHVNHQLHPQAEHWARAARARARSLRVPFQTLTVSIDAASGESLEALAREARYRALAGALAADELLLTAHHQRDQLETVLMALLRGSGVRGLSGMRALTPWAHTLLLRPLLGTSRAALERYAARHALSWSEDPSNHEPRFDRSYLRQRVLPLLEQRWPAAAATASRSAAHLAEAQALLEQQAHAALQAARDGPSLRVSALRRLPLPQRRNAVRHWMDERGLPLPDHRRLREITGPMLAARVDAAPRVRWRGAELRRHADRLYAFAAVAASAVPIARWDWRAEPALVLAADASLSLVRDRHGDVRLSALPRYLSVDYRHGGERLAAASGHRALKDLLQAQGLAPWERSHVPVIRHSGGIVAVGELWLEPAYRAGTDCAAEDRGRFRWRQHAPDRDIYD